MVTKRQHPAVDQGYNNHFETDPLRNPAEQSSCSGSPSKKQRYTPEV